MPFIFHFMSLYFPLQIYFHKATKGSLQNTRQNNQTEMPKIACLHSHFPQKTLKISSLEEFNQLINIQPNWSCRPGRRSCCKNFTCRCNLFGTNCRCVKHPWAMFFGGDWQYVHNICPIFSQYFPNLFTIFAQYVHNICPICTQLQVAQAKKF